jgi:hypothetical protein
MGVLAYNPTLNELDVVGADLCTREALTGGPSPDPTMGR